MKHKKRQGDSEMAELLLKNSSGQVDCKMELGGFWGTKMTFTFHNVDKTWFLAENPES